MKDAREIAAQRIHDKLSPVQRRAAYLLSKHMGHEEMVQVMTAFYEFNNSEQPEDQALRDCIHFWYGN
jgi:hypothetical protein